MPCGQEIPPAPAVETPSSPITKKDDNADEPSPLPYWLVNVPRAQWPSECPEFLRDTSLKNIRTLSTPDEQYRRQGWEEVKRIIGGSLHHGSMNAQGLGGRYSVLTLCISGRRNEPARRLSARPL